MLQRFVARPVGERNGGPPRPRLRDRLGYRARTLGVAFTAAFLALVLTLTYVRSYKRSVDAAAAEVTVFVAARDIPVGTPAAVLDRRGFVERERIPRRLAVAGAVSTLSQLSRAVAAERTVAGEQLTSRRFEPVAASGIRGDLNGTLRAIAVPGDANQLLTGLVEAGDRVDVVATSTLSGGAGGRAVARVVLRALLVLRAPVATADGGLGDAAGGGRGIVLALTDRQAQKLFFAIKHGQWALILRPHARSAESPERLEDHASVFVEDR